jgi:Protein of unknown function (DUF1570)
MANPPRRASDLKAAYFANSKLNHFTAWASQGQLTVGGYVVSDLRGILESADRAGSPQLGMGCSEVLCEGLTVTAEMPGGLSRRSLVKSVLVALSGLGSGSVVAGQEPKSPGRATEAEEIAKVEKLARDARLGPLDKARSVHFLAVGDAPESHQSEALTICEALGEAFLVHFRARGFNPEYPEGRLTVIALRDRNSYAALLENAPGMDVGGHYDLETNRLVIFDFRPQQEAVAGQAERVNLFTLVHETAHQLSFNTGILNRQVDLPVSVSEGLATYVELWRPGVKNAIGGVNRPRIEALRQAADWIQIGDLLADDTAFEPKTQQLAYAESWLLVHYLLRSRSLQPRFRQFVAEVQVANKATERLRIAEKVLGPLAKLDHELKNEARKYLRG